jgi:hypothetical protein
VPWRNDGGRNGWPICTTAGRCAKGSCGKKAKAKLWLCTRAAAVSASVFINGYDIAAHLSLLVVVVAIMEHWIGRAGARGGIYDGSARGWRRRGRGEGTGRRGRTEGGQVSYATPPLIVLRPWQQSSSAERGEEEDEMTKPPACCRCCCALGGVGMR